MKKQYIIKKYISGIILYKKDDIKNIKKNIANYNCNIIINKIIYLLINKKKRELLLSKKEIKEIFLMKKKGFFLKFKNFILFKNKIKCLFYLVKIFNF
ncbi:hypothetical protein ACT2CR_00390 [Candidatus Vidania fulgoroideorum]